eukprot:scaffold154295_cov36-Prasinocladus_malaysianus.AAC.2
MGMPVKREPDSKQSFQMVSAACLSQGLDLWLALYPLCPRYMQSGVFPLRETPSTIRSHSYSTFEIKENESLRKDVS